MRQSEAYDRAQSRHPILSAQPSRSPRGDADSGGSVGRIGGGDARRPTVGIQGDRGERATSRPSATPEVPRDVRPSTSDIRRPTDSIRSPRGDRSDTPGAVSSPRGSRTPGDSTRSVDPRGSRPPREVGEIRPGGTRQPSESIRGADRGDRGARGDTSIGAPRGGTADRGTVDINEGAGRGGDAVRGGGVVRGIQPGQRGGGSISDPNADPNGVQDIVRADNYDRDARRVLRVPDRDYDNWRRKHHDHDWDDHRKHHDSDWWSFSFHWGYPYYYSSHRAHYYIDGHWWDYPYYYSPDLHHTYYYFYDRWYAYPRHYYWYRPRHSFYWFVDLGDYVYREVPVYVVEHQKRYVVENVEVFESDDPLREAYAAFANQDYYHAVASFSDALYDYPDDGLIYFGRAQAYVAIRDYRAAYEDILDGMELIPDWPQIRLNITEIYSEPIDFDIHLAELEQWVRTNDHDYRAHFVLGYVYYFLQEYELAKAELVRVLRDKPGHPVAERFLDEIYQRELEVDRGVDPAL